MKFEKRAKEGHYKRALSEHQGDPTQHLANCQWAYV